MNGSKFSRGKFLLLLMIPGVAFYAIFQYWPFYGLLAAFKDYQPRLGILGSPWADNYGFAEFIRFFTIPDVWNYVWNTIVLSVLHIIWLFPLAIILALFINELRGAKFKKIVQTVSYLPHFVSVAAVAGMLTLFLSSQQTPVGAGSLANEGIINQFLLKLHLGKRRYSIPSENRVVQNGLYRFRCLAEYRLECYYLHSRSFSC